MSFLKQLAGETAIYGLSSILSRVLSFVLLTPYLTYTFQESEDYGTISLLFGYAAILLVLYTIRMETTFFRFGSRPGELERSFSTAVLILLGLTALYSTLLVGFAGPLATALNFSGHPEYIYLITGIIAADALVAVPFARLRLENRPWRFAAAKTLAIGVNVGVIFFLLEGLPRLAAAGHDWAAHLYREERRIAFVFLANLVGSGVVLVYLSPYYRQVIWRLDGEQARRMLRYAVPLIVVGIAAVLNQVSAIPLLEYLLPYTETENRSLVGIYTAVAKLAILMNLFTQAFNYAAEPFFFRNATDKNAPAMYAKVAQAFALVAAFGLLVILLYLDQLQFLLGKNYREGLGVVPLLLVANFMLGLYYNFAIWYKLVDRTVVGSYLSVGGVVLTLLINFTLIPRIGYYAAALATLACYTFLAAGGYFTGRRAFPVPYRPGAILGYLVWALALYGVSEALALRDNSVAQLAVHTGLLVVFVVGVARSARRLLRA